MNPRFYLPQIFKPHAELTLPEHLAKHLHVLRCRVGDMITLFDGQGLEISARIQEISKKTTCILLEENSRHQKAPSLQLHLGQALCRSDRMDIILQKAVELNASDITPIYAERSQGRLKGSTLARKMQHWREILVSACEQCQQNYLPQLHEPVLLSTWLQSVQADLKLHFATDAGISLKTLTAQPQSIALLIGPEGGFTDTETQSADQAQFMRITLGERILRVETAAILALGLANYQFCG
jgi:16S rRNA (uracil1498-N3)-methyltransferase